MKSLKSKSAWLELARHAAIVAGSAVGTFLLTHFAGLDWGPWAPIAMAALALAGESLDQFTIKE